MPEAAQQIELDDGPTDDELMAIEAEAASSNEDESADKQPVARMKAWTMGARALSPEAVQAYEELQELFEQNPPACRGADECVFFPERGASTKEAKGMCAICPIKADCLEYALVAKEKFGIWGGTSERERRRLRRKRREQKALEMLMLEEASPAEDIEPVIVLPIKRVDLERIKCVEAVDSTDHQAAALIDTDTEQVSSWIKRLTGDPSRRQAVYAGYKSGTLLAKSDQIRPVKKSRPSSQSTSQDIFSIKRRQPTQQVVALEMIEASEEINMTSDNGLIASAEIDWPTNVRKADLIELCEVLAKKDGTIRSPSGLVKSELKSLGLNYTSLGTTMKAAEDCGLVQRDIRGKRTFVIALTEAGWQMTAAPNENGERADIRVGTNEVPDSQDVEKDEATETTTELENWPTPPDTKAAEATNHRPESGQASFGEQLAAEALDMAKDVAKLAEALKEAEQQLADLSEHCESLEQENQQLKHILGGFKNQLQDVLP